MARRPTKPTARPSPKPIPQALAGQLASAGQLLRAGRAVEAADAFAACAKAAPRVPEIENNLGVALRAAGRPGEAIAAFRRAISARPDYGAAFRNLARAARDVGDTIRAIDAAATALDLLPDDGAVVADLVDALIAHPFDRAAPAARRSLITLVGRADVDIQRLAPTIVRFLLSLPAIRKALKPGERRLATDTPLDPLLAAVLSRSIVASTVVEEWLVDTRDRLLVRAADGEPVLGHIPSLASVALQFHLTEFVQPLTSVAADAIRRVRDRVAHGDPAAALILVMTEPVSGSGAEDLLAAAADGDRTVAELVSLAIEEPATEAAIRDTIPSWTEIGDAVSVAVSRQYEAHPYPRWRSIDRSAALPLAHRLGEVLAGEDTALLNMSEPALLVAGCGTGRHAIRTAMRIDGADVTAIDLSRSSLAHAQRMADVLGVQNIRFAHADILGIADRPERYDVIECSGVLHHMDEPILGWRRLVGLLKPGGLIRIALYSRAARESFAVFRSPPPEGPDVAVADAIRRRRQEIFRLEEGHPARVLTKTADFYAVSGCRDLLFHAREVTLDLQEIEQSIDGLGLRFLGFEFPSDGPRARYRQRFPDDPRARSLSNWAAMEADDPALFLGMYQFWCRKPETG